MPLLGALAAPVASVAQASDDNAPSAAVRATVDSASVAMGDRVMLRVEVVKNRTNGALFNLPREINGEPRTLGNVEVREVTVDSTPLPNGRMQLNYNLQMHPLEVGVFTFPQFKYVIGADTFYSDVTTLKVREPLMPKMMVDSLVIHPYEPQISIKPHWYDYVPSWWYWVVIGGAVVALGVVVAMLYRTNGPTLLPRRKVVAPHVLAMQRLDKLKASRLAENGQEKEYYTELTEILRQYLEGRFGINALEMSTTQIREAVNGNADTAQFAQALAPVLETADFVKFAKVRPLPDENIKAFNTVRGFVEATRPVEEPQNQTKASSAPSKK